VWQYDAAAKTATRWRYSPLGSHTPICSEVRILPLATPRCANLCCWPVLACWQGVLSA
jgi:hypothetical protein